MSEYTKAAQKAGDQVLETIKQVQGVPVSAVESVSKTVGGFIPELPQLSIWDKIPTAHEVVKTAYGFADKLLDANRDFALSILDALQPISSKVVHRAADSAPATNGAAKK